MAGSVRIESDGSFVLVQLDGLVFGGYFQTKTMLCRLVPKDKKLLARSFCISAGFPGAGVAQDICNDF